MKPQKKIPGNINPIEVLVLVPIFIFIAFFITCASAVLGPPFFRLMDYNVTSSSITDIEATSGLLTSFVAVIVGYLIYELTTGNQQNKSTISTDNGTMQCNYLQTEKSSPDTLKCVINPLVEYDPCTQEVCKYCKNYNFLNCPRIKVALKQ